MSIHDTIDTGPIQHNITPDKVVFCYRENDSDSLSVAEYYKDKRGLPSRNLIPLPCSSDHTLTLEEFNSQIYNPLVSEIAEFNDEYGSKSVWVIILGYNIPNAFIDAEGETIAVASRIHRLGLSGIKTVNKKYDQAVFYFFDDTDASELYITSVLDGKDVDTVKRMIDRGIYIDAQLNMSGFIYIDPHGNKSTQDQLSYQNDLTEFYDDDVDLLGFDVEKVNDSMFYDSLVNKLENDVFYWGWFIPRYSADLIIDDNSKRAFLYNADNDSAADIRQDFSEYGSDPWCNLAINLPYGYASTAGSIDTPGETAYLRPRPFFRALQHGASVGEAFLHSCPVVNWKIFLIGDPLMCVNFPYSPPLDPNAPVLGENTGNDSPGVIMTNDTVTTDNNQTLSFIKYKLESSLSYGLKQSAILLDVYTYVIDSTDMDETYEMVLPMKSWSLNKNEESQRRLFAPAAKAFSSFIRSSTGLTVDGWLEDIGELISPSLADLISKSTSQVITSIAPEGYWTFTFTYTFEYNVNVPAYFVLELSDDNFATYITIDKENAGWKYEYRPNVFIDMDSGFDPKYSGRRVRFVSQEEDYLEPLDTYRIRWKALDTDDNVITDYVDAGEIIINV